MKQIGGFLVLMGAGSFILNMLGREFTLIMWIDNWGQAAGIAIRIALILAGAGLWVAGQRAESKAAESEVPQE